MDLNTLKIDIDLKKRENSLKLICERLSYIHDLGFFNFTNFESIILEKKTNYAVRIFLKENLKNEKDIILFQLILGSDWRKEVNTLLNHYKLNMEYSNRLFTCKRYKGGKIKTAIEENITEIVKDFVYSKNRKHFFN